MTSRTKRVLIVVLLAVVAAAATKWLTNSWRCSTEADYERARINLKPVDESLAGELSIPEDIGRNIDVQTNSVKRGFWKRFKDSATATYKKGTDAVKRPYRETRHMVAHMPEYIRALIVFQMAVIADAILVWIVIALFLFKVLWWAAGKLFNAWIDGSPSVRLSSDSVVEILDNGDAIIHIHQLREKKELK